MKEKTTIIFNKFKSIISKRPLLTFLVFLTLFVLLVVIGNFIRKPKIQVKTEQTAKTSDIYTIGSVPKITFQAQIEKNNVIQIVSSTSGVVNKINVKNGLNVKRGTNLVSLASNYSGGNSFSLSRQLAEKQNNFIQETFSSQMDLISTQRKIAENVKDNFKDVQDISNKSIGDTENLISLNSNIISTLNNNIQTLSTDPVGNAALILSSKQMLSQFESANLQLRAQLRNTKFQTDTDKSPSKLSDAQKALTLKQLDIQTKSLELNKEISQLQLQLTRIAESMMYPTAPFDAQVEQVLVRPGQQVNPGTPLLILSSKTKQNIEAIVYMPKEDADKVSRYEKSTFNIGDQTIELLPTYITQEATNGNLYAVIYILPVSVNNFLTDKSFIDVKIPVGYPNTNAAVPYIPLDAVYQTQENAYVFLLDSGKAKSQKIQLGDVFGSYVRVISGLNTDDIIILDRNIIAGDLVETK